MTIGNAINKLRSDANLSQEQFATLFDVSQQSVQKWENGVSVPDLSKIIKISKHFGVSLDALILGIPLIIAPKPAVSSSATQSFEKKRNSSALFAREINLVTQPSFDCEQGINSQVQTVCSNADAIFPVLGIVSCRNERFSLSRKTHVSGDLTTSIVLSYSTFLSIDDIFKIIFYILTLNFSLPQKEHWRVASTQWPF